MHALLMVFVVAAVPVSGRVVDTAGKPVPNAKVELSQPGVQVLRMDGHCTSETKSMVVTADEKGRFQAEPDFVVTSASAEATDYVPVEIAAEEQWRALRRQKPIVLKLRKDPFVELEGTVVDATNAPIPGVVVAGSDERRNGAVSDAAGHFKFKLRSSEKRLWVYRKNFVQREYPRLESPMKIELVRRPTMAVYLVEASGKPIQGFHLVEAFNAQGSRVGESRTREIEGDCTLEGQLGDLTVRATVNGKTVTQKVTLKDTQKIDVTLQF